MAVAIVMLSGAVLNGLLVAWSYGGGSEFSFREYALCVLCWPIVLPFAMFFVFRSIVRRRFP